VSGKVERIRHVPTAFGVVVISEVVAARIFHAGNPPTVACDRSAYGCATVNIETMVIKAPQGKDRDDDHRPRPRLRSFPR
jgi:hypothetical protein